MRALVVSAAIGAVYISMGLYVWIALGAVVGVALRMVARRYAPCDWLESMLMGIAGAVVGGWIGARIRGMAGIDDLGWLAMILAIIGAGLLDAVYLFRHRRQFRTRRTGRESIDETERKAA